MARKIERIDAKRLYCEELLEIPEISNRLHTPEKTIYRWKSEDKEKEVDWDKEREEIRNTSFTGHKKTLKMAVDMIDEMARSGVIDAKKADTISKVVKAAKSLFKDIDSLGNILLAIGELTDFMADRDPEMLQKLVPYLNEFGNVMSKKYGKKS